MRPNDEIIGKNDFLLYAPAFPNDQATNAINDDTQLAHDYPVFNDTDYYGLAGEVSALATVDSEADPLAVYLSFLVAAAALIGKNKYISVGETRHNARIFSVLVGSSSRARKGTSFKPVERIIRKAEEVYNNRINNNSLDTKLTIADGGLSSAEGLIYAVRDESEDIKKDGEPLWEGIIDKRLFVVEEELANVLKMTQREGNTLSPVLRRAWDGGMLAPMTKNNKLKATGSHINLLAHITHFELKLMLNKAEMHNGLANRFLWACVRRPKKVPFPQKMDDSRVYQIAIKLSAIMKNSEMEQEIILTDQARSLWAVEYHKISVDETGLKAALTARSEAYVIRLALLFALLDNDDMVTEVHIKAAMKLVDYCNKSAEYIFTNPDDDATGDTAKLLAAIQEKPLSQSEISALFNRHKNRCELKLMLDELQSMNKIRQKQIEGSKKIMWEKI